MSEGGEARPDVKVWTYFGSDTNMLERRVQDLIDRGGRIISLAIGYGPSPAKAAGLPHGEDSWHAMIVLDASGIDPNA